MQISAYCQQKRCPEMEWFHETLSKESRWSAFGMALKTACEKLVAGESYSDVLKSTDAALLASYGKIYTEYGWQAEGYAKDDVRKLRRFLVFLGKPAFLEANVPTVFDEDGLCLEGKAGLVFRDKNGKTYLVVLRTGKCDRSAGGKSLATKVSGDLRLLVAKYALENKYPGIIPWCVYMTHPDDADSSISDEFIFAQTKATNLTVLPISSYYTSENGFLREKLAEDIFAAAQIAEDKNCDSCDYACICKAGDVRLWQQNQPAGEAPVAVSKEQYTLPKFTPAQMEVVNHINGPLLVCAGAGSGKTAALVGRIAHLVKSGVAPSSILCLTFARAAADEIAERCNALIDSKGRPPKISTIHGLAMEFLCGYGAEMTGKCPKALDELSQQRMIDELLENRDRIPGFKYEKKGGRYGLLKTVLRNIEELDALGHDAYQKKHPDIGAGFYEMAKEYHQAVKEGHYLSFDEMVALAAKLLQDNEEVLNLYRLVYRYIMVDEFQDISADQAELVYLLAGEHKNLVVVGDDDQCIYRWRGAMPSFMVDFPETFGAKTVIFPDNFRSSCGIVETAQRLIQKNPGRIEKNVVSSSGISGTPPQIIRSINAADVRRIISEAVTKGYRYGDMAVIARTNSSLANLKDSLGVPCSLARRFLRQDVFFGIVRAALNLSLNPEDAMSFVLFSIPFGLQYDAATLASSGAILKTARGTEKFKEEMEILDTLFLEIRNNPSPKDFIEKCAAVTFWSESNAPVVMQEEFTLAYPEGGTLDDLRKWCYEVVEYQSEKRVNEKATNAVTLITNHDAKGLEFPVVLLICEYTQFSPEERSLFYVGITRAKEQLYIFESNSAKASFLSEITDLQSTGS